MLFKRWKELGNLHSLLIGNSFSFLLLVGGSHGSRMNYVRVRIRGSQYVNFQKFSFT